MIPKFSSQTDMMGFIRALPANANYQSMLASDFGIVAPADAAAYQKEYLWKYLVQGTYLGKSESELLKYAAEGVEKLAKTLPHITVKETFVAPVAVQNKIVKQPKVQSSGGTKRKMVKQSDGTIHWDDKRKTYIGWVGGKIVSSTKTIEKCRERLTKLFNITSFNEIDLVQ